MSDTLLDTLPLAQRLALSYASRQSRDAVLALMALDQRLAGILRQGGEPILAQMKLAWWRERLAERPENWPEGEPLLEVLRSWPGDVSALSSLVNGWEVLLAEQLGDAEIAGFAEGRAGGWTALAGALGADGVANVRLAGERWALVDLAHNLGQEAERDQVLASLAPMSGKTALARNLRPLAVLDALSVRAVRKGSGSLLGAPAAGLLAMRVGILGR